MDVAFLNVLQCYMYVTTGSRLKGSLTPESDLYKWHVCLNHYLG